MKEEAALEVLNFYRNQHYTDSLATEEGQLADAINTILPSCAALYDKETKMIDTSSVRAVTADISNSYRRKCGSCEFNDGICYTSNPPAYKCTFTNAFHMCDHVCDLDLKPLYHSHWVYEINPETNEWEYKCPKCSSFSKEESDFCPHCGTRMDEELPSTEFKICHECGSKMYPEIVSRSFTIKGGTWVTFDNIKVFICSNKGCDEEVFEDSTVKALEEEIKKRVSE